jgi:hypothetical protein
MRRTTDRLMGDGPEFEAPYARWGAFDFSVGQNADSEDIAPEGLQSHALAFAGRAGHFPDLWPQSPAVRLRGPLASLGAILGHLLRRQACPIEPFAERGHYSVTRMMKLADPPGNVQNVASPSASYS